MSEKSVGTRLLDWSPEEPDPQGVARGIIARDRLYARLISAGLVVIWLVAAALLFPLIAEMRMLAAEFSTTMRDVIAASGVKSDLPARLETAGEIGSRSAAASVFLMVLAALATLLAVWSSRRATLRQVNASLIAISDQLRRLGQDKAGEQAKE